ncbi:hypothetical protein ACFZBU_15680 [Embleya sp. NPDC008237]|uniref:hypothetical protein n=1 Tax=Embleya sp. NPDC008237 TaxID=3363978 RepID=UPI0036EFF02A
MAISAVARPHRSPTAANPAGASARALAPASQSPRSVCTKSVTQCEQARTHGSDPDAIRASSRSPASVFPDRNAAGGSPTTSAG